MLCIDPEKLQVWPRKFLELGGALSLVSVYEHVTELLKECLGVEGTREEVVASASAQNRPHIGSNIGTVVGTGVFRQGVSVSLLLQVSSTAARLLRALAVRSIKVRALVLS